jgi:hypothetical protein
LESAIKRACDHAEPDIRAGLLAAIDVCRDRLQTVHAQIREANRRYGIEHPERTLVRDLPPEPQELNERYRHVRRRINDIEEVLERLVIRPDGKQIVLPRGHTFGGFSEDGKVITGHMTLVHHEDRRRAARTVARPGQRRTRERRPGASRRAASSSTTASADPGDDSDSESPAPAILRVRRPSGTVQTFEADRLEHDDAGILWATGRWRRRVGLIYAETRYSHPDTYGFGAGEIVEVRT